MLEKVFLTLMWTISCGWFYIGTLLAPLSTNSKERSLNMDFKLDPKWKWAAKDKDNTWNVFVRRPTLITSEWAPDHDDSSEFPIIVSEDIYWKDSLHQIIDGKLVKHIDLKVDDKVMVKISSEWHKRHFSHFRNNIIFTFDNGCTSFTSNGKVSVWPEWRLPTQEELL